MARHACPARKYALPHIERPLGIGIWAYVFRNRSMKPASSLPRFLRGGRRQGHHLTSLPGHTRQKRATPDRTIASPPDKGFTLKRFTLKGIYGVLNNNMKNKPLDKFKYLPYKRELTQLARQNRKNPSPAEKKIWHEVLCRKQFEGYKFTRQKPLGGYLYC
jgi:hypothetical protein